MEYSLKGNLKGISKPIKSKHHNDMKKFVDICDDICYTSTIEKEAINVIPKAVSNLVDNRLGTGYGLIRRALRKEVSNNLKDFFTKFSLKDPTSCDVVCVRQFYDELDEFKLIDLMFRKGVEYTEPEPNDLQILAEMVELRELESLYLISFDRHFTFFKDEIKDKFDLDVWDIYDVRKSIRA